MRFHQAVQFLTTDEMLALAVASDDLGYDGLYVSDHLFNPKELSSRYTYSKAPDGSPFWEKETEWPDPMCLLSAIGALTSRVTMTTGVYIPPVRDLITVAKTVGTADVISGGRVRLGVGVGWCKEEFDQTGQDFHTRGKRLNEMIPALQALWAGGWVEWHGKYYDVPACQMNPSPGRPIPILGGGDSDPALVRATTLCDGWLNTGAALPDEALGDVARVKEYLARAGRADDPDFSIYIALAAWPDVDLFRRMEEAGVTDLLCAPWMGVDVSQHPDPEDLRRARMDAVAAFAEDIIGAFR